MLSKTQIVAIRAFLNQSIVRIAAVRNDAAELRARTSVKGDCLGRVVLRGVEVIDQVFAARIRRSKISPANTGFNGEIAARLPTVLKVSFGLQEPEAAIKDAVRLRDIRVVAEEQVCDAVSRVIRIQ